SAAELLDPVGMANYVAANSFLEGLARRRRALGLRATCVAWGGWSDLGMAGKMSQSWERRWERRGIQGLDTYRSFDLLLRLIDAGPSVALVMQLDWHRFAATASADQRALFAPMLPKEESLSSKKVHSISVASLPAYPPRPLDGESDIASIVHRRALNILQLPEQSRLDPDMPLADLGFDSLMSLELRDVLATDLNTALPATLLFDHPTLSSLIPFVSAQVRDRYATS
ncbi:MAG TPA: beta-ketoacyl reductase, partial [Steroidobacteraceae bacterium]|nr:beta-ketoacyl reductase [Steroidobacteraceae bacterium]